MEQAFLLGLLLVIIGGFMEGGFSLGLQMTPEWEFENTWGMGSLIALVFIPWPVAFLTIPNLGEVFASCPTWALVSAVVFGVGWGIGGIFWGLGVSTMGLALAISIMMGLTSAIGSAGPLLIQDPAAFGTPSGLVLIVGLVIMIVGVAICANAGSLKSRELAGDSGDDAGQDTSSSRAPFVTGLIFCILGGALSSFVNFGFAVSGKPIIEAATAAGAAEASAPNAVWALVFTANYLVNFLYGAYLMMKNKTAHKLFQPGMGKNWGWAFYLGILWPLGVVLYGIGAAKLGKFGAYAGFPLLLICSILGSNILGAMTGEWKDTGPKPRRVMTVGVSILVFAAVLFGYSTYIKGKQAGEQAIHHEPPAVQVYQS
jgi:L-rhamnose-H+ transport protein